MPHIRMRERRRNGKEVIRHHGRYFFIYVYLGTGSALLSVGGFGKDEALIGTTHSVSKA